MCEYGNRSTWGVPLSEADVASVDRAVQTNTSHNPLSGREQLSPTKTLSDFSWMEISELKSAIEALGGDHTWCIERAELVELLVATQRLVKEAPTTVPIPREHHASRQPAPETTEKEGEDTSDDNPWSALIPFQNARVQPLVSSGTFAIRLDVNSRQVWI